MQQRFPEMRLILIDQYDVGLPFAAQLVAQISCQLKSTRSTTNYHDLHNTKVLSQMCVIALLGRSTIRVPSRWRESHWQKRTHLAFLAG